MDDRGKVSRAELAELVRTAATPAPDSQATLRRLAAACWPGGADRTVPPARVWLRGWGPIRMTPSAPECVCRAGRCPTCN
jgi:hypothetical protein